MATDPNILLAESKCYECFGPLTISQLLVLALLRRSVLAADPAAAVDPQSLVTYGKCFACYGMSMSDIMQMALLDMLAQAL